MSTKASASRCWTAWKDPTGRPNCRRGRVLDGEVDRTAHRPDQVRAPNGQPERGPPREVVGGHRQVPAGLDPTHGRQGVDGGSGPGQVGPRLRRPDGDLGQAVAGPLGHQQQRRGRAAGIDRHGAVRNPSAGDDGRLRQ